MRHMNSLLVILALFLAQQAIEVNASRVQVLSTPPAPELIGAELVGKKLYVVGGNFNDGARILINGEPVKTKNDPDNPTNILIAKKAGKQITRETSVVLTVQNAGGAMSEPFDFFSGLTITLADLGKTFVLKVGEKFLVSLKKSVYDWEVVRFDESLLTKLEDPSPQGTQGIFQAARNGTTQLTAVGVVPCQKSSPPCFPPSLFFEVRLTIE
jgi:hypothetical protein